MRVKINQSSKDKAAAKAKGVVIATKTEVLTFPVSTVQEVMDALKKSTAEVVKKSEDEAKKQIERIKKSKDDADS